MTIAGQARARIIVLTAAPAYKCPAAPYEGAMLIDDWSRRQGLRDRGQIEVYAAEPAPMGVAGPHVSGAVTQLLAANGIPNHPEHRVTTVETLCLYYKLRISAAF